MKQLIGFLPDIEARKRILKQILSRPRSDRGRLDYEGAFTDHPEWRSQLGWDDPVQKGRAYAMASAILRGKTGKKEANGHANGNGQSVILSGKSKLSTTEVAGILDFINANRRTYASNQACFDAALEATGCTGKIINSSGAAARYFEKAKKHVKQAAQVESTEEPKAKRTYTKRAHKDDDVHEVRVNFCPQCGCNIHKVAMGMAMAKL